MVDLNNVSAKITFEIGQPFFPFQQLLGCLPPASRTMLPRAYQWLMVAPESPVLHFYPLDFGIGMCCIFIVIDIIVIIVVIIIIIIIIIVVIIILIIIRTTQIYHQLYLLYSYFLYSLIVFFIYIICIFYLIYSYFLLNNPY